MDEAQAALMPRWKSHKQVRAAPIVEVHERRLVLELDGGAKLTVQVDPEKLFARYTPKQGDFFMVYRDGYESISPRREFVDGYTRQPT
jgi:hypothetical protein